MAGRRRPTSPKGQKARRQTLRAMAATDYDMPAVVPIRWVSTVVAIFLLPVAAVLTQTFFTCLSRETISHAFWATEAFWFFSLGAVLWVIAFFGLPRPLILYVFGHELTHALWVWMMGGRVTSFRVSREGGHITTDLHNFWVALAPYFFPLYSIMVVIAYGIAGLFWDVTHLRTLLFALIGATWAFHISFTLWMIPKGQSDITYYGTFFSLVVIYLLNLAILSVLLVVASQSLTWEQFGGEILDDAIALSAWLTSIARNIVHP